MNFTIPGPGTLFYNADSYSMYLPCTIDNNNRDRDRYKTSSSCLPQILSSDIVSYNMIHFSKIFEDI